MRQVRIDSRTIVRSTPGRISEIRESLSSKAPQRNATKEVISAKQRRIEAHRDKLRICFRDKEVFRYTELKQCLKDTFSMADKESRLFLDNAQRYGLLHREGVRPNYFYHL